MKIWFSKNENKLFLIYLVWFGMFFTTPISYLYWQEKLTKKEWEEDYGDLANKAIKYSLIYRTFVSLVCFLFWMFSNWFYVLTLLIAYCFYKYEIKTFKRIVV